MKDSYKSPVNVFLRQALDRFLIDAFAVSKLAVVLLLLAAFVLIPTHANLWNRLYTGEARGALYIPFYTWDGQHYLCCWRTADMRALQRSTAWAMPSCGWTGSGTRLDMYERALRLKRDFTGARGNLQLAWEALARLQRRGASGQE